MAALALASAAFVVMEPLTYLLHRFVMHGRGWTWHASHHGPRRGRFEANDRFPLVIASVTGVALAAGYAVDAVAWLVPLAWGAAAYGLVYALVHEVFVHRRLRWRGPRPQALERLAAAHRRHHQTGGEPYGLLVPSLAVRPSKRRHPERVAPSGS